jgi:hypothetical protein
MDVLKARIQQGDCFKELRNRKKHSSEEAVRTIKKATKPAPSVTGATKNFFAPLWTMNMNTDAPATQSSTAPIVLASATKLIQLQKQPQGVSKQIFEFRSTKNETSCLSSSESPLRIPEPLILLLLSKIRTTYKNRDPTPS